MDYQFTNVDDTKVSVSIALGDIRDLIKIVDAASELAATLNSGNEPSWKWKTRRFSEQLRAIHKRGGAALEYEGAEIKNHKLSQEIDYNA